MKDINKLKSYRYNDEADFGKPNEAGPMAA